MSTPASSLPDTREERSPLRFVTAASLFDDHDAATNMSATVAFKLAWDSA